METRSGIFCGPINGKEMEFMMESGRYISQMASAFREITNTDGKLPTPATARLLPSYAIDELPGLPRVVPW